jgi:hypothetical protein
LTGVVAAVALAVASLLVACGDDRQPEDVATNELFGVNAQFLSSLPARRWDPHLAAMRRGGLTVVRKDASWGSVEPTPPRKPGRHVYRWAATDRVVRALADHGLRWYPIVDYSAPWASISRGDPFAPPARNSDYVAFARALAARYGRQGRLWKRRARAYPVTAYEIWNEPNTRLFWRPQRGAPERYAALYRSARRGIHQVDPHARVIVGGLTTHAPGSTPALHFLKRMAARLGGLGSVDAVGLHPYADSLAGVFALIRDARGTLDDLGGPDVPLDITEVGWSSARTADSVRARWLAALARDLPRSGCRVEALVPHTWVTGESNRANPEDWFGIANRDGSPKPSGQAYLRAIRAGAAAEAHTTICGAARR